MTALPKAIPPSVLTVALALAFAPGANGQASPGDVQIGKYLAGLTDRIEQRPLNGLTTARQWEAERPRLRREYFDMLGLWPLPEKTPLHATVTGTLEREGVVIEKLHYQSRPGLYVTANLYRPKQPAGRLPAVLYLCGHSGRGRDGNKTAFQDHGLWFATNGYVCLVLDSLQLGEIPGVHHGTYSQGRWWWQARGYTPAGVECWNGIRGLDYLVSRPDVDPDRLGVTGISGGGAATFWVSAADDRVRCAVPVSGMSDLESYVKNKVINGHCDCMFLYNTYQWEWTTIAGLIAPRPLLFANSDNDSIFPMDGNRRIMARLRGLYQAFGKPELVEEYVSKGGHAYRPDLRVAAFKWINKHLKKDDGPVKDAQFKEIPGKELRVFPEDKDVPKDALNGKVDEFFVPTADIKLPASGDFKSWKKELLANLRNQVFHSFPGRIPSADYPLIGSVRNQTHWVCHPGTESKELNLFLSEPFTPDKPPELQGILVLEWHEESTTGPLPDWAKPYLDERHTARFLPRQADWTKKSPPNYVERAHALLGRTFDAGRVWDIAAMVRYLDEAAKGRVPWRVVGRGQLGVLAAYAALLEPAIKEVVLIDPPTTHRDGPILLNVLRVLDIPDALGLLAPEVKLTLVHARDKAFDRSAELYQRAGAAAKLHRID